MYSIEYVAMNKKVIAIEDKSILTSSIHHQIPHLHECGGNGRCTTCRVRILEGNENISKKNKTENEIAKKRGWTNDIRLACQTKVHGPVRIERLLWSSPEITGLQLETMSRGQAQEKKVAILSCDLRGFTTIASNLMAFDTAHFLNQFYTILGDPILANNGVIYQYVGDEIVGIFGVGEEDGAQVCENAIRAALGMLFAAERLNKFELSAFEGKLKIGIGISYGLTYLGYLGHPKQRQFAVIGDNMNRASRVQNYTKAIDHPLLITEETRQQLAEDTLDIEDTLKINLAGIEKPQIVHVVNGFREMDLALELQSSLSIILKKEDAFVNLFYEKLFEKLPQTKSLFKRSLENQKRLLMHMITSVVHSMSRPHHLKMGLKMLGRNHKNYGVQKEHYPIMLEVFMETLKENFKTEYTQSMEDAWRMALHLVTGTMMKAY